MSLEALARSMAGGLTYGIEKAAANENDWDRLTALAMGSAVVGDPFSPLTQDAASRRSQRESLLNSLGTSLIALKGARRTDLFNRVVMELKDCLRWRLKTMSQRDRLKVAKVVIPEWVDDVCRSCNGARHVFDHGGVKRGCLTCASTGKRRYSDEERAISLGVIDPAKWARAIGIGHFQVSFAVAYSAKNAHVKLGSETEVQPINT